MDEKKIGEVFTVEYDSTPSTGYRWYLTHLDEGLALLDYGYKAGVDIPGAGGKAFFTFQAVREADEATAIMKQYRTFDLAGIEKAEKKQVSYRIVAGAAVDSPLENLLGGWSGFEKPDAADLKVLQEATGLGVDYTPILVSKQVVKGLNYLFICNGRIVYPGAQPSPVLIKVYSPPNEKAKATDIIRLGNSQFVGSFGAFKTIEEREKQVFETAQRRLHGVDYTALCVSEQVVSGMNYLFAANAKVVYPGSDLHPVFVKVYQTAQGDVEIRDIIDAYNYR